MNDPSPADPERDVRPDWNVASRSVVTGLHFLRMSADKAWIVRHELSIDLTSSNYARQGYEADVDMGEVTARLPPVLAPDRTSKIWVPVLRIPSLRPADQRIRAALGTGGQVLPIMPQSDVRRYFANAITWLILNNAPPEIRQLSSARHALVRNEMRRRLRSFIRTGDERLFSGIEHEIGLESGLWDRIRRLIESDGDRQESGEGEDDRGFDEYDAGISEAIKYCRLGYFIVVGLDPLEAAPHVAVELLPPELTVKKYHQFSTAEEVIGFRADGSGGDQPLWRRPLRLPRIVYSLLTTPSRYHLRISVPEIADLNAAHVQVRVPDDVCAEPAVLHHDQWVVTDENRRAVQSRCRGRTVTPSPFEVLERDLSGPDALPSVDAARLVARELELVAREWEFRAERLDPVERLTGPSLPRTVWTRIADRGRALRRAMSRRAMRTRNRVDPPMGGLTRPEQVATTELRQQAFHLIELASRLTGEIDTMVDEIERGHPDSVEAGLGRVREHTLEGLEFLRRVERSIPPVEITADDDRREHVAHFHVDSTRTVHHRTTDSRPVIHAIVRPSRQGRKDYVGTASLTCLTSTLLLLGVFGLLVLQPDRRPNAEALVALLLLVPGLSVSLLGRIPGETVRQLVLGRAQRLASLSLIPPVVTAVLVATVFAQAPADGRDASLDLPFGLPSLRLVVFLAITASISAVITLLVVRDRFRGLGRAFTFRSRVLGLITYRAEEATDDPGYDEATAATTNTEYILQLTEPALFQITRPSQRFMVWVVQNEDEQSVFKRVVAVLENLPRHLNADTESDAPLSAVTAGRSVRQLVRGMMRGDDDAGRRPGTDPTIVESSLVMSVATTGVTMSVVSHDLGSGARGLIGEREVKSILERKLYEEDDEERPQRPVTVIVQEIDEDTRYFRYRAVEYQHYAFVGQVDKSARQRLITELLDLDDGRSRRISYLYCPIMARPDRPGPNGHGSPSETSTDEGAGAVRVGFAVVRDEPDVDSHLRLRMAAAAASTGYVMSTTRSVADGSGSGLRYSWDEAGGPGANGAGDGDPGAGLAGGVPRPVRRREPHVLLSAGPDDGEGLREAFALLGPSEAVLFEGGTVLTDGGYTCRSLRFWADGTALAGVEHRLGEHRAAQTGDDRTAWMVLPSNIDDPIAGSASPGAAQWVISWIRWRLELDEENGVAHLLSVLEAWARATRDQVEWWITFTNIEFLANRLHDRRLVSGKARYRLGVHVQGGRDPDDLADEINQSLETFLRAGVAGLLTSQRHYVVVDRVEPQNPLTALVDSV